MAWIESKKEKAATRTAIEAGMRTDFIGRSHGLPIGCGHRLLATVRRIRVRLTSLF